jgi:hypothetical protein
MERIFIPTVSRPKQQITFENLPTILQQRVTMVVQSWERNQYHYDCEYLVLPEDINLSDRLCLAKTRAFIYREARSEKYSVLDDDLLFQRRNSKRFTGVSNMEKSARPATDEDIIEMFETFSSWIELPTVTVCGPSQVRNFPRTHLFQNNTALSSAIWVNGNDFDSILDELPLIDVKYNEDVLFLLSLLTRGFGNRASQEYCIDNTSLGKDLVQVVWNGTTHQEVWDDHKKIAEHFPDFFKIPLEPDGTRVSGGYRNFGKAKTLWSKAYKSSQSDPSAMYPIASSQTSSPEASNQGVVVLNDFNSADYRIPGNNQITLSADLEADLRHRFKKDRENRFHIYLMASGIRRKYLDEAKGDYAPEFQKWYKSANMTELFGSLQNFTKYAMSGEVVNHVATNIRDPEKHLLNLPLVVGSLYELSMILKQDADLFNVCLHFTPKRKSVADPKHEWKTTRPALITPSSTEQKIRSWRQKWNTPPAPKVKRSDKRTLPFITITCSGELLDFDRKTGDKTGCLDLDQVEAFLAVIRQHFGEDNALQFKIEDHMDYLNKAYFKRKDYYDPAKNILTGKSKKQKYT